ncbi:Sensor histidine kinase LiaS [Pontiella desulfatans]|uniref:Sensor histidine kinase LiaS n=1 Tax=Pontiella desulfatans TaxID=2750659 RepID=A0A6C2U7N7_PONDE|nr:histidine kinase [Pontiella desulfatans]VGO15444.1 Sensor histidine kinase LiaS [Pontiella desulfatans]
MPFDRTLSTLLLLGGWLPAMAAPVDTAFNALSLPELEQRRDAIGAELEQLANYSLRSGVGAIGYRSNIHDDEFHSEWVEINLQAEYPLDQVILVPVIRRDAKQGFQADGFPKHLRLIAGTEQDRVGTVVAEYTDDRHFLPRIAPLSIPCNGITASWIRIETDRLSLRAFDEKHAFELSEIMAFSGDVNVALRRPIAAKSNRFEGRAWSVNFAVDGLVPYLMDAVGGEKSIAFISLHPVTSPPALTIDLGESQAVSLLHLHAIDPSDVLPQALASDFGIPKKMHLEGANQPDFSDAETLIDLRLETIFHMGPIMMWNFPPATNRFYRLHIDAPPEIPSYNAEDTRFGFAEIELLSGGINHALGKPITGSDVHAKPNRPLSVLTDGRNMYGTILPVREWMNQLVRRHDLEKARPRVEAELNRRYAHQKTKLRRMGWLAALLTAAIGFTMLIDWNLRLRQLAKLRERFAADLHDELGANIHAIGLLSDAAKSAHDASDEWNMLHQRIRQLTERTGTAIRHFSNIINADGLYQGLVEDMQRAAQRITANLEHTISIEGEHYLEQLKARTRIDLFLFYKESLINICRHSNATRFSTTLTATPREIVLTVSDNGKGMSGENIPSSLKRRARLLKAKLSVEPVPTGGTCLKLRLRHRSKKRKMNHERVH